MRNLETLATYVVSDFFYYIGNIYVYILNSLYVITEHYVPGLCVDSALTGLYAVLKWTIVCSGLIPSWELSLSSLHPAMLIIYLCSCVEGNTRSDCQ